MTDKEIKFSRNDFDVYSKRDKELERRGFTVYASAKTKEMAQEEMKRIQEKGFFTSMVHKKLDIVDVDCYVIWILKKYEYRIKSVDDEYVGYADDLEEVIRIAKDYFEKTGKKCTYAPITYNRTRYASNRRYNVEW